MDKMPSNKSAKEASEANNIDCPECGMPQEEWKGNAGKGVKKDDETYCCSGCASGGDCNCG